MAALPVYLAEFDGYSDAAVYTTYRFSLGGAGYTSLPTDSPPNTWFDGRMVSIATVTRKMFSGGGSGATSSGTSDLSFGYCEMVAIDGLKDSLFRVGSGISFRERAFRAYSTQRGLPLASRTLIQRAVVAQCELSREKVTIHIKDRLYELDTPHITTTYAGNNVLPAGVEGTAELAGKEKPYLFGTCFQIEPKLVNTSKLIFQISTNALLSATVYDGGNSSTFTVGAAYTSQADMEANGPSTGEVRFWLAGGMFRLGSNPTHVIRADASAHSAANSTAAQLIKALALARGIDSADISASDVAALDAANSAVLGVWVDDSRTTREIIDLLASTVGAYVGFDEVGVLRMSRFDVATGTAAGVFSTWNVKAVDTVASGEDVPVGTVALSYARYYGPIAGADVSTSISASMQADLKEEWRVARSTYTPSPNPYKRLNKIERETAFAYKADADAEAARLLTLYQRPRGTYLVSKADLTDDQLRTLGPNSVIELRWPRYGFSRTTGTLLRVIEITKDYTAKKADMKVWG